jgi:hypothetical protein
MSINPQSKEKKRRKCLIVKRHIQLGVLRIYYCKPNVGFATKCAMQKPMRPKNCVLE